MAFKRRLSDKCEQLCTEIIHVVLYATVLNIFSKKLFVTHQMSKDDFEVHMKHFLIPGEIKVTMKCYRFCTISLNFEIYFLTFPWEIVFGLNSDCKIRTIILEKGFSPIKTETARFPLGFCLKLKILLLNY